MWCKRVLPKIGMFSISCFLMHIYVHILLISVVFGVTIHHILFKYIHNVDIHSRYPITIKEKHNYY